MPASPYYNAVGVPRVPRATIARLSTLSTVALAAHCDQLRAGPMSTDTFNALLCGIAQVGTYGRRAPRKVAA